MGSPGEFMDENTFKSHMMALDIMSLRNLSRDYERAVEVYMQGPEGDHPTTDALCEATVYLCNEAVQFKEKWLQPVDG